MSEVIWPDGEEPTLVMPFVVVQSYGGPFEDRAFVAGAQYGQLSAALLMAPMPLIQQFVMSAILPQVDLLAMHRGYLLEVEPLDDVEWSLVTLTRIGAEP